ncbi:hypothetical protein [Campylobacter gastrosuis]|uniref:Uncharacterized protein n=1 Tax=Campylobacter gastrosuis TaxID=2974576 RepID=A0ABT7HPG1_9BACT|nr:hypothetical protein [Campylobacter gastrosuis]MDL0088807.1 hypothetical protein [Campylobacter gastrosuis]
MKKSVIAIRTNRWGTDEERIYTHLLKVFNKDEIFAVIDELKGVVKTPKYIQKISLNGEFLAQNNLLDYKHPRSVAWLCGDYFYYALSKNVNADFYYLIEPDVFINFDDLKGFFDTLNQRDDDALLANIHETRTNSEWYEPMRLLSPKPYGCLFSFTGLSHKAIEICLDERQKISEIYISKQAFSPEKNPLGLIFVNDETLVTTTLYKFGLKVGNLKEIFRGAFDYYGFRQWVCMPLTSELPKEQVMHPVRNLDRLANRLMDSFKKMLNSDEALKNSIIDEQSATHFASIFAAKATSEIRDRVIKFAQIRTTLSGLKSLIMPLLNESGINYTLWFYEQEILVLDIKHNNSVLTIDFELKNGLFRGIAFVREGEGRAWLDSFKSKL